MILKINFANPVHQRVILVRVIKILAPNVLVGRIESCRDTHVFVRRLTMKSEVRFVHNAAVCVKNVK